MVPQRGLKYLAFADSAALVQAPDIHITTTNSRSSKPRLPRKRGTFNTIKRTGRYQKQEGCHESGKMSACQWMNRWKEEAYTPRGGTCFKKRHIHQEEAHASGDEHTP